MITNKELQDKTEVLESIVRFYENNLLSLKQGMGLQFSLHDAYYLTKEVLNKYGIQPSIDTRDVLNDFAKNIGLTNPTNKTYKCNKL